MTVLIELIVCVIISMDHLLVCAKLTEWHSFLTLYCLKWVNDALHSDILIIPGSLLKETCQNIYQFSDFWTRFEDFQHLKSRNHLHDATFFLTPGRRYRVVLKVCAGQFCFQPVYSNGVTVIPHPPKTGLISVELDSSERMVEKHDIKLCINIYHIILFTIQFSSILSWKHVCGNKDWIWYREEAKKKCLKF